MSEVLAGAHINISKHYQLKSKVVKTSDNLAVLTFPLKTIENPYSFQDSLYDRTQKRHGRRARCTLRYFATARFEWPTKLSLFYPRNPRLK